MRKLILLFVSIMCCYLVQAQDFDDIYASRGDSVEVASSRPLTKKEQKERKKRLKQLNDSVSFNRAVNALATDRWVLMADRVTLGRMAYTVHNTQGNTNFVMQYCDKAVVQVALNYVDPGANGLGGITLDGHVTGKKLKTDKKGDVLYQFHLTGSNFQGSLLLRLYSGGNKAEVIVDPTFGYGNVTLYGTLLPYDHSRH